MWTPKLIIWSHLELFSWLQCAVLGALVGIVVRTEIGSGDGKFPVLCMNMRALFTMMLCIVRTFKDLKSEMFIFYGLGFVHLYT